MAGRIRVVGGRAVCLLALGLVCGVSTVAQAEGTEAGVSSQEAPAAGSKEEGPSAVAEGGQSPKSKPVKIRMTITPRLDR